MVPSKAELRSARWVAALFALVILLQRVGIPGVPFVGVLVLIVLIWTAAGLARGVLEVDRTRLIWWLAAAGVTAAGMLLQARLVVGAEISITAWVLVVAVWLPFITRLVERSIPAYLALLRYVTYLTTGLALLALAMTGTQLLGIPFRDWFSEIVPASFQLAGFNTISPIIYGSSIMKANGWIGLEPSVVSALIGLGLLAAFFVRARLWIVLVLILGLVSTVSGSGVVIVLVGVTVMLFHRSRRLLLRYAVLAVGAVALASLTPFGSLLIGRSTEFQYENSSTTLRAIEPYRLLYPQWIEHFNGVLLGYGPGSSQRIVADSNVLGLLVPSPAKVFFEYGLLPGLVLAAFILGCYWGSTSRAFALALLASLWSLQPGITTSVFVIPVLALVSLWSPRTGAPIESMLPAPRPAPAQTSPPVRSSAMSTT